MEKSIFSDNFQHTRHEIDQKEFKNASVSKFFRKDTIDTEKNDHLKNESLSLKLNKIHVS